MSGNSERRRSPRIRLDGRTGGRATVLADFKVVALSETGALLEIDLPLAVDSECDLTLELAHVAVDLKGRVMHVEERESTKVPYRVGVDFLSVPQRDQALLESFLDRERRRAH